MKKLILKGIITAGFFLIFVILLNTAAAAEDQEITKAKAAEQIIKEKSEKVISLIASRNFTELADYVHPEKGLRFTPYTYVRVEKDVVFTKKQLSNFFDNDKEYIWGHYDGSGREIKLTPKEYYHQFIYTKNFINADVNQLQKVEKLGPKKAKQIVYLINRDF